MTEHIPQRFHRVIKELEALSDDDRHHALEMLTLHNYAGRPQPVFLEVMPHAVEWAKDASPRELKAYYAACWKAMSEVARKSALEWQKRESGP